MNIGKLILKHGIMLAPMAGFSDYAMRRIAHEYGAEYSVTEMVSAKAVVFGDEKTRILSRIREEEGPVAIQLFGSEPDTLARATEIVTSGGYTGVMPVAIDINMGCPVKKIFSNGEGSALMRDPSLIYRIVWSVVNSTALPVTVKMRLGIDRDSINVFECAEAAESAGASAICVHGRTRVEMYGGEADIIAVAKVKNCLHIPLVANGDITSADKALSALTMCGGDGIAIGRGAIGNPFIFREIISAIEGKPYIEPSLNERIEVALRQIGYAIEDKGEAVAIREARGQIAHYFKGFRGAAECRFEINRALTLDDVKRAIEKNIEKN